MRGRLTAAGIAFEQFGDAEIEQLHCAVGCNENIRRFQVPMHDQIAMCVRHRRADLQHQPYSRGDAELTRVAVIRDGLAFDEFECEIRHAIVRHAAVVQLRDVRMRQLRQDAPFAQKARAQIVVAEIRAHQFQGHMLTEIAVVAFGEVDAAHAAFADPAQQAIRADAAVDQTGRCVRRTHLTDSLNGAVVEDVIGFIA